MKQLWLMAIVMVSSPAAVAADGGACVDPLEWHALDPAAPTAWTRHSSQSFPGGRVEVGTQAPRVSKNAATERMQNSDADVMRLVEGGRSFTCDASVPATCLGAPQVQRSASTVLVCLPSARDLDTCIGSGFSIDWSRRCVLFDLERRRCALLPFGIVDARLDGKALEADVWLSSKVLARAPSCASELLDSNPSSTLLCDAAPLCVHCPPPLLARFAFALEDGFPIREVRGALSCGEASCDKPRRATLEPVPIGCPPSGIVSVKLSSSDGGAVGRSTARWLESGPGLRHCYDRELASQPTLAGTIRLGLVVERQQVKKLEVMEDSLRLERLTTCVSAQARHLLVEDELGARLELRLTFTPKVR